MSRTTNKIIKGMALALLVGGVIAPSAGGATDGLSRTPTERDQAVGEPGEGSPVVDVVDRQSQAAPNGLGRTPTEVGQAVGEPGDPSVPAVVQSANQAGVADGSNGFDWGDAAIGAGLALILGTGALAIASRRRGVHRKLRTPMTSS
jgi:hypothetical protein